MDRTFGWDLPPGVTESMIPGNRPEDVKWERDMEEMHEWIDTMTQFMIVEPVEIKRALTEAFRNRKGWRRFMIELKKNREIR